MDNTALFEEVRNKMGEFAELDVSQLTPESRISNSFPGLDSLQMFEMLVYLEETLEVEIDETVIDKFETLGDLVSYIKEKRTLKSSNT